MALRLVNKINRQFIKNVTRSMSSQRESIDVEPKQQEVKQQKTLNENLPPIEQYQVCRPRTSPVQRFHKEVQNETDVAKQHVAMQHLQPALLPEYYKPPLEIRACMYSDPSSDADKQSGQNRRFEESKTCLNVTLPLKVPKLASPFPSPVKVMQSHTVSDQEKSEQMLAEAKVCKGMSSELLRQHLTVKSALPCRSYSTDDQQHQSRGNRRDCPKLNEVAGAKKACAHIKLPHCAPVKSISCKRFKQRLECKKKEAPYPSYSESCHEDPIEKPSECKLCPWKPDDHPTFKPVKQNFHTSSASSMPARKDGCQEPTGGKRKPCGWVELEKKKIQTDEVASSENKKNTKPKKKTSATLLVPPEHLEAYLFTQKKKPCTPSKKSICEKHRQKEAEKRKSGTDENKQPKKKTDSLGDQMGLWLDNLKSDDAASFAAGVSMLNDLPAVFSTSERDKPCKKFPFKQLTFPLVRKHTPKAVGTGCRRRKRTKLIKDCPGEVERCKKSQNYGDEISQSLRMLASDKEKGNKKCPRVDLGVCKNEDDDNDDPCKRKRTGKTLICPENLIGKKRREPKKKSSPIMPIIPPSGPAVTNSATGP